MDETITVLLPAELKSALENVTRSEGIPPSQLVSQAVKQYLFLRRFRLLRDRMRPNAEAQGIFTDQDAFDRVS